MTPRDAKTLAIFEEIAIHLNNGRPQSMHELICRKLLVEHLETPDPDAARYRWIRDSGPQWMMEEGFGYYGKSTLGEMDWPELLDATIDAAIKEKP